MVSSAAANAAASTALYVRAATLAPEPFSTGLPPPVFLHLAVAEKAGRVVAYGSQHPGGRLVQVSLGELEQAWLHQGEDSVATGLIPRYGTTLLPIEDGGEGQGA